MSGIPKSTFTRRDFIRDSTIITAGAAFASGIWPIISESSNNNEDACKWFRNINRQLILETHFGNYKEIFNNFDADAAAEIYEEAGVDLLCYFGKCQDGYSYYPTKIGIEHPGLNRDFTGELTRALKKRGIRCMVYFFPAMERRLQKIHPDWIYQNNSSKEFPEDSSIGDVAMMCFHSPYMDKTGISQMNECLSMYDLDGIFVDIVMQQFLSNTCYCRYCRELFNNEVGGDIPTDKNDPKAFIYRKWSNRHMETFIDKIQRALTESRPEIAVIINYAWMSRYPVTPPEYVPHVTWDTPTPVNGLFSLDFSFESRYLSSLPDVSWSCMNVRMNNWTDYTLRETEAFLHECAIPLGSCGTLYQSDVLYPSGNPDPAVMEAISTVNDRILELDPCVKGTQPVMDTAVLHSADSVWSKEPLIPTSTWQPGPAYYAVCGAHKALIEGHVQMAILNSGVFLDTIDDYNTLVLPNQRILSDSECEAVRRFVKNGGALLATGETAVRDTGNERLADFSIADVLGIKYVESSDTANCYLRVKSKIEPYGIPGMDVQVKGNYVRIKTTTARTLFELVPPYEGIKNGTPPPAVMPEGPGVTINSYGKGKAIYCAAKLFDSYYTESTPVQRKLALWMLEQVYSYKSRSIFLENTPINVEVFYNQRSSERFIHLVNYSGDKRGNGVPQTQDFPVIHGIRIHARTEVKPSSVTTVPDDEKVTFTYSNGWITFDAEPLYIHGIYHIRL